jgi:hypothetical protein
MESSGTLKLTIADYVLMGFCDIGDGMIARVNQRVMLDQIARSPKFKETGIRLTTGTPGKIQEDYYRRFVAEHFDVGFEIASHFPPSAETQTYFVSLTPEEIENIGELRYGAEEGLFTTFYDPNVLFYGVRVPTQDYVAECLF